MTEYYFDMETTGLNPSTDKIITIQWQRLSGFTGEPIDDLHILTEWDSSEERILKDFLPNIKTEKPFDFIIVGKNLLFDFMFLSHRARKYDLNGLDLQHFYNRVSLDIKPVLVIINNGDFRGYDKVLDRTGVLVKVNVPQLYKEKRYPEIIKYIKAETEVFLKAYQIMKKEMPSLSKLFDKTL